MGCFRLNSFPIRMNKNTGHQTQGSVTLCQCIRLYISIVILAGPHKTTSCFQTLRNHIINETMLVPDVQGIKLWLIVLLKDVFKDIFESTIILFQDGVLRAHVERPLFADSIHKTTVSKISDCLVSVVHPHVDSTCSFKIKNINNLFLAAISWCK